MSIYRIKWMFLGLIISLLVIISIGYLGVHAVLFCAVICIVLLVFIGIDLFWVDRAITYSLYPPIRDSILSLGLWAHGGRQGFHIGWLDPRYAKENLLHQLRLNGFEHDILAWKDDNEVLSERKRFGKSNRYQYHLRLFDDGELRGHMEFSPEYAPIKHLMGKNFADAAKYFTDLLGDLRRDHCSELLYCSPEP